MALIGGFLLPALVTPLRTRTLPHETVLDIWDRQSPRLLAQGLRSVGQPSQLINSRAFHHLMESASA
ncbi:hypothetical protein EGR_08583 [Echinococcus granulosus]|uniref:Uncharacterized protein n=1 Tax=Echinococcus granulosus TaxID=6210 RepID=W6UEN6_ECHGR|nr:hypothetical protein EGR_08583 [Echinococcus granulosus]EUB56557.1 hypothetical protein EGR_08583 [Echinococcus granulosus]